MKIQRIVTGRSLFMPFNLSTMIRGKRKDSISSLILKLKTLNQEANIEYLHEPTSKWMIKNLTFSLEQER